MTNSPYDNLPSGNSDTSSPKSPAMSTPAPIATAPPVRPAPATATPATPAPIAQAAKSRPNKTKPFTGKLHYTRRKFQTCCGTEEFTLPFEESLLVPDTMPDMQEALFAEGKVQLPSHSSSGIITVFTVYRPINSSVIDVIKSSIPFNIGKLLDSTNFDTQASTQATAHPTTPPNVIATIADLNVDMINERKFLIKGCLTIKITRINPIELNILKSTDDENLLTAKSLTKATCLIHETTSNTEISQTITVNQDLPSPVKILKSINHITETHRQITSGKLVINATIHTNILYLGAPQDADSSDSTQTSAKTSIPSSITAKTDFTQFIALDAPDTDIDPDLIKITFDESGLDTIIETQDKFLLQGTVSSDIKIFENRSLPSITDAYHKKEELCFDLTAKPLQAIIETLTGEISSRELVDINPTQDTPICGSCIISSIEARPEQNRIVIEGKALIKLLSLKTDEAPSVIECTVPIRGALATGSIAPDTPNSRLHQCTPAVSITPAIKELWWNSINAHQLEVNLSLAINLTVCSEEQFTTIENLCFIDDPHPAPHIPMAIYVVSEGDSLWSIAKRYKTDVPTLAKLNGLAPDANPPEGAKLFVSC
ncbi:MAG: LysM domain-containing protein [Bacillota bacterium]|nr:LysM domain-containing protein [Bacillota bacterium]